MTTFERVREVIVSATGVAEEEVTEESVISSFCEDSLEAISLIQDMEMEFGIDIDEPSTVRTVRDAVVLVDARGS